MFALVDGESVTVGELPFSARRQDMGRVVHDLPGTGRRWRQACGWFEVVDTEPPAHGDGEVAEFTVELVDGRPVKVWTVRPLTVDELAVRDRRARLAAAADVLREWAAEAALVTVTSTNAVQVLNVVVDRLAVFFDRFADLLEER